MNAVSARDREYNDHTTFRTNSETDDLIVQRVDCSNRNHTLSGQWKRSHESAWVHAGRLGEEEWALIVFEEAADEGPLYVVRSYDTPIAWCTNEGQWTVPNVKYSKTTTNHLSGIINGGQMVGGIAWQEGHYPNWDQKRWLFARGLRKNTNEREMEIR